LGDPALVIIVAEPIHIFLNKTLVKDNIHARIEVVRKLASFADITLKLVQRVVPVYMLA